MLRSLYTGVTGLLSNQKSMDVIGNNIANVNTVGFKMGRAVFQDLLSTTLNTGKAPSDSSGGVNPRQVGTGVYMVAVDNIFSQGTITSTSKPTDLAIDGNGFFAVRSGDNIYYTRAGDFNFDVNGYLNTPSGCVVQGWMADPTTGEINAGTTARDICVSSEYQVIQAHATENVQFAGVLSTQSEATIWTYPTMFTQASGSQSVFTVKGANNMDMDLTYGQAVTVKAHATGMTDVADLYEASGQPVNMKTGDTINFEFTDNSTNTSYPISFTYSASGGNPATREFKTLDDLVGLIETELQAILGGGVTVSIEEGQLAIQNNSGSNITINSLGNSNSSYFNTLMSSLIGTTVNVGQTKYSNEMYFQKNLKAGEDFTSMDDLARVLQNSLDGNVITGLNVEYLENDFGMAHGNSVYLNFNGTVLTLQYTEDNDADLGAIPPTFHTMKDFAAALQQEINGKVGGVTVSVEAVGDSITVTTIGASDFSSNPFVAAASNSSNSYLENLMTSLFTDYISGTETMEISGKGRIVYTNDSTSTGDLTGFSVTTADRGDGFSMNVLMAQDIDITQGGVATSARFLTIATEDTTLVDLFDESGNRVAFNEGTTSIAFDATINDTALTGANLFTVEFDSTVADLMEALEEYLGLGASHNTKQNVKMTDGQITVTGEAGASNDISTLSITAHPTSDQGVFNNSMSIAEKTQSASGGNFTTDMPIYDGQGNKHLVRFEFSMFNEEKNEWIMRISSDDPDVTVRLDGVSSNELIMKFNKDGTPSYMYDPYTDPITIVNNPTMTLRPGNGANTVSGIKIDLGSTGKTDGFVISNASQSINVNEQDGYPLGVLQDMMFNTAGEIIGVYSNGLIFAIGQVALATFQNNQGLLKVGDTMFQETVNSGSAAIGTPESGARGSIAASALEQSNVDLSQEFVDMIVTQRGFQANSRIITTSDEMIQELLSLKR